ncbi:MAG: methylated-DNA--[protein]-cysteine S-methyltransferase [Candidatus Rokubacteria bacterium]|nr:methylated-DNA--[protein]-cysteine S-methyltransferase [Candidatus Rokubacteria bacterium]
MSRKPRVCADIEPVLLAAATGEAEPAAGERLRTHLERCAPCAAEYRAYQTLESVVDALRRAPVPEREVARARRQLEERLGHHRRRTLFYRVFPSPLGNLLIAASERGVSLVEYLWDAADVRRSRLARLADVEAVEDGDELEARYRELLEYLEGRRMRLDWPLDLRLVRSEFHRTVLEATARIPYGAVTSYAGLACSVGRPDAVRAVAQALRWNPVPIVIPCHRVVGTSGALTGYAGNRVSLKERLLRAEGVPAAGGEIARRAMYVSLPEEDSYCLPTCAWLGTLEHPHRVVLFGSRERAEAAGRRPCSDCRPDLHPLSA